MNAATWVATTRTFLSVPGDRPDLFSKADQAGTGMVLLDLQDGVAPGHGGVAPRQRRRPPPASWTPSGRPATECVVRLAFGSFDLAPSVLPEDREATYLARQQLVIASAAAGCAPPLVAPTR